MVFLFILFAFTFIIHLLLKGFEMDYSKAQFIKIEQLMENCSYRGFTALQFYVEFENVLHFKN